MFGLKNIVKHFSFVPIKRYADITYIKYGFFLLLLVLLVQGSFDKYYKRTAHRYIYPKYTANTDRQKYFIQVRKEVASLNNKLIGLKNETKNFFRIFTPEARSLYLAGNLQHYKIYESMVFDSTIPKELKDLFNYTILKKARSKELKEVIPCPIFTKHVYEGLKLKSGDISYEDVFMFSPHRDTKYLKNQNIEFLWDIMQVKYLIIGPEFSKALEKFTTKQHYKLLDKYPDLRLNLYEITKPKSYSKLAFYPLGDVQGYAEIIRGLNSKDIDVLKRHYSKLLFLDENNSGLTLLKKQNYNNRRYYEINSNQAGILIDFESWSHNWELKINNKEEKLQKAFQMFKGIRIEPGLNQVQLTYNLKYFKGLFLFSVFVTLVHMVLLFRNCYKERRGIVLDGNKLSR